MNNSLSNFLVEQILLEDISDIKNVVVVYSGRFQPFHSGHYETYQHLVKKFGKNNVYIGTTNKVELPKSPFNFKEKEKIMNTMFGISKSKIVEVKNPYKPTEILNKYDEKSTAYITVVGDKDSTRLGGNYFQKYNDNPSEGYKDKGYVYISPKQSNAISGTDVRNGLGNGTEEDKKEFFTKRAYPNYNQSIFDLLTSKLNETFIIEKETIEEWLLHSKTIYESSAMSDGQADDGPTFMFPNYDIFSKISTNRAKKIGYDVVNLIMKKELEDYYDHPTYPTGPVSSVSYFPAGVLGKSTATNQIDIYSSGAYSKWYKHMTRSATLCGYELVNTQIERDVSKTLSKLAGDDARGDKENIQKTPTNSLIESITLPVDIGDTLLMGKFKNKKVVVKSIGKDEHGMPTINGKKVVTFRYHKKGPNIFNKVVELVGTEIKCQNCGHQWKLEVDDNNNYVCHNCGYDAQIQDFNMDIPYIKKNGLLGKPFTNINENRRLIENVITKFKNLGIPREDMPQINSKNVPDFLKHLKSNGISFSKKNYPIYKLKLTQKDLNMDKIDKMMTVSQDVLSKPIIVSKDEYIMDGHHRVLAKYALNTSDTIPTIQINLPIRRLLAMANSYEKVGYKTVQENLTALNEATNIEQYKNGLIDLRNAVDKKINGFGASQIDKLYYQNALNLGIKEKFIDNPTRLKLNRHNKKFGNLGGDTVREIIMNGIDILLSNINESTIINEATNKLKLKIPNDIKKIHSAFKKNGKKLYVVGGAVRDAILGKNPKDFDLATDAKPDETLEIAKKAGFNTTEVGKSFGVVIVGGHEIATFRRDVNLKNNEDDFITYLQYMNVSKKEIDKFKKEMR